MNPVFAPIAAQAIQMPGLGEMIVILLIVLVVFGSNKIPQLGHGLGMGIRNFKRAMNDKDPEREDDDAPKSKDGGRSKSKDSDQDSNKNL